MKILETLVLRGPNLWSRRPVLEAWVDLGALDRPSTEFPGLAERLEAWLPSLIEHRCGLDVRGGFLQRLREGTYPGHILEHLTLELQALAGTPVGFGKARETRRPGLYKVAVRIREETVGRACLLAARELLLSAIEGRPFDIAGEVARLKALADEVRLGPSTAAIVDAADRRRIPFRRLNEGSLVQLGTGARARRVWTAETDRTTAIAEWIAHDKELTKRLLRAAGVPVPEGRIVESADDAWAAANDLGLPVAVKPCDGNHGRGVFTELASRESVEAAFAHAQQEGSAVLVERSLPGNEHRLLVVGGRMVAAARGEAAWIEGDGVHSVRDLVESQLNSDPRRGTSDDFPLSPVELDPVCCVGLARQGHGPDTIPEAGKGLLIQRNGNVAFDVTETVHPRVAEQVVLAAQVVGLDIAGIDLVAEDLSRPLEEQRGAIVEVNAGPGLHMHLMPANGPPRPVGEAILDALFAPSDDGRIPTVCVTGGRRTTEVTRLLAHLLKPTGRRIGVASGDGLSVGARQLAAGDQAGFEGARRLLLNPKVELAVLEARPIDIVRRGLGCDVCDVAVVTDLGGPDAALSAHHLDTPDELYGITRCPVDVVAPTGTAVLCADDAQVARMAELSQGGVVFFSSDAGHPLLAEHRRHGRRAAATREGSLLLAEGARETALRIPEHLRGPDVLPAAAAAWVLGLSAEQLQGGLDSFPDTVSIGGGKGQA